MDEACEAPAFTRLSLDAQVAQLRRQYARVYTRALDAEALVTRLTRALAAACPPTPMNQDEQGGCVWCGGTPPGRPYGYVGATPAHHREDCGWRHGRALLEAQGWVDPV